MPESQFYKMHSSVLVEDIPFQRCFCDFFIIQSRITTLKNSKGDIKEINSISQLSVSLVLSQSSLRGQGGPSVAALLDPMHSTLHGTLHGLSHLILMIVLWGMWHRSPFYKCRNWDTLSFNTLLKLANIKSGIYTQMYLISNLFS